MNNTAIYLAIAEIEGFTLNKRSNGESTYLAFDGDCPLGNAYRNMPFSFDKNNPTVDPAVVDALCYRLMLKHDIQLGKNNRGDYVAKYTHCQGEEDADPNKAILLAIIAKSEKEVS